MSRFTAGFTMPPGWRHAETVVTRWDSDGHLLGRHGGHRPDSPVARSQHEADEEGPWHRQGARERRARDRAMDAQQEQDEDEVHREQDEAEQERRRREAEEEQERQREEDEMQRVMNKYNIYLFQLSAGVSRLLFEDMLNLFVQGAFSIKYWDSLSSSARFLTLSSTAAGLILALVGPLRDLRGWCRAARRRGPYLRLDNQWIATDETDPGAYAMGPPSPPGTGRPPATMPPASPIGSQMCVFLAEEPPGADESPASGGETGEGRPDSPTGSQGDDRDKPFEGTILGFIQGTEEHSVDAHRLLILSALGYWGSTAAIPLFFRDQMKGGTEAGIPMWTVLYFALFTLGSLLAELWVAAHTQEGLDLLMSAKESVKKAFCQCQRKECKVLGAILQSLLGRYDTFCDAIFTCVVWNTEEISEIRFDFLGGVTLQLPYPLHYISAFSLVVGIFACQAAPGMWCLTSKMALPAAFKLNEFSFLLAMVQYQC